MKHLENVNRQLTDVEASTTDRLEGQAEASAEMKQQCIELATNHNNLADNVTSLREKVNLFNQK